MTSPRTMRCAYCGDRKPWDRQSFPVPFEALCQACIDQRDAEARRKRERLYLIREGHLLGGTMTLMLEHFVSPWAAAAYLWIIAALWLRSARLTARPSVGDS